MLVVLDLDTGEERVFGSEVPPPEEGCLRIPLPELALELVAVWPSGKALACNTRERGFDSRRRLLN